MFARLPRIEKVLYKQAAKRPCLRSGTCFRWLSIPLLMVMLWPVSGRAQWHWQYPVPSNTDFSDIYFVDGRQAWLSGMDGSVYYSADGGMNWELNYYNPEYNFKAITFVDSLTGWAVGIAVPGTGLIMHTADGGHSWVRQTSMISKLYDIQMINAQEGWAVGSKILHTGDGGNSWHIFYSYMPDIFYGISFIDSLTGWVCGNDGDIIKYTNGGQYLTHQSSYTGNDLNAICFINEDEGWAVGNYGVIVHTTNGGDFWSHQSSNTDRGLNSICFADGLRGWIAGDDGTLLSTTDGGLNWVSLPCNTLTNMYCVEMVKQDTGFCTGECGTIHISEDGGNNWGSLYDNHIAHLNEIEMINSMQGWAVGTDGAILHTLDGGEKWVLADSLGEHTLNCIQFVD